MTDVLSCPAGVLVPNDTLSGVQGATVTVGNSTNGTDHVQCGVILIEELVYSKRHFVCADGKSLCVEMVEMPQF